MHKIRHPDVPQFKWHLLKLTDLNDKKTKKTETTNFERMQKQLTVNGECESTLGSARVTHKFTHTSSSKL